MQVLFDCSLAQLRMGSMWTEPNGALKQSSPLTLKGCTMETFSMKYKFTLFKQKRRKRTGFHGLGTYKQQGSKAGGSLLRHC